MKAIDFSHGLRARLCAGAVLGLATMTSPVTAQHVYRCGNTYTQTACDGARQLGAVTSPSDDTISAAQDTAARERRLVDWFAAERREQARQASPALGITSPDRKTTNRARSERTGRAPTHGRKKLVQDADFVAVDPASKSKPRP